MLYLLFYQVLQPFYSPLRVFGYITVRTALSSLTALLLGLVLGPWMIRHLRAMQIKQFVREEGPRSHQAKTGTPTMGGILIVVSTSLPTLLWDDLTNPYVLLAIFVMLGFAAIGFVDDYAKVVHKRNQGLTGGSKLSLQIVVSACAGAALLIMTLYSVYSTALIVPFFKNFRPSLLINSWVDNAYLWLPGVRSVSRICRPSHGRFIQCREPHRRLGRPQAIGCVIIAVGALTVLTYITSHAGFSAYLDIQHVEDVGDHQLL